MQNIMSRLEVLFSSTNFDWSNILSLGLVIFFSMGSYYTLFLYTTIDMAIIDVDKRIRSICIKKIVFYVVLLMAILSLGVLTNDCDALGIMIIYLILSVIILIVTAVIHLYKKKKHNLNLVIIYWGYFYSIFMFSISMNGIIFYVIKTKTESAVEKIFYIIVSLIFTNLTYLVFDKLILNRIISKGIYFWDNDEKRYIYYKIDSKYFLTGDNKDNHKAKKSKLVKIEDIASKELYCSGMIEKRIILQLNNGIHQEEIDITKSLKSIEKNILFDDSEEIQLSIYIKPSDRKIYYSNLNGSIRGELEL